MAEMVANTGAGVVETSTESKAVERVNDCTVANPEVFKKYGVAAQIANFVLFTVTEACQAGIKVGDLCRLGDATITQKLKEVFTEKVDGKHIDKGIGFPTCVNVNNCLCHFSPLASDPHGDVEIRAGDWVKIDLGVQIDGYLAVAAHTIYGVGIEYTTENPMTGKAADVVSCLLATVDVVSRLARPGRTNHQLTRYISRIAEAYGVRYVVGTIMHQMRRYVIDGSKIMLLDRSLESKIPECEFEVGDVFGFDIAVTSSTVGVPNDDGEFKPTIFKRNLEAADITASAFSTQSGRQLFNAIRSKHPVLPFSLSSIDNDKLCRLGVRDIMTASTGKKAIVPYPVLHDEEGSLIAHVKFTCIILPQGNIRMTGLPNPHNARPPAEGEGSSPTAEGNASTQAASMPIKMQGLGRGCVRSDKRMPDDVIQFLMGSMQRRSQAAGSDDQGPAKIPDDSAASNDNAVGATARSATDAPRVEVIDEKTA